MITVNTTEGKSFTFNMQGKKFRRFFEEEDFRLKVQEIIINVNGKIASLIIPEEFRTTCQIGKMGMLLNKLGTGITKFTDLGECAWYDDSNQKKRIKLVVQFNGVVTTLKTDI
jgi:hypothetical protein